MDQVFEFKIQKILSQCLRINGLLQPVIRTLLLVNPAVLGAAEQFQVIDF
jgi:hypothetical protein